jgi:ABC-type glycerol-3-phosphate transport system permease component
MADRRGLWANKWPARLFTIVMTIIVLFPLLWVVSVSMRPPGREAFESYFFIIPKRITLENYHEAIEFMASRGVSFFTLYRNSIIVSAVSTVVCLIISMLMAYSFALHFRLKLFQLNYFMIILYMTIPTSMIMIPAFVIAKWFQMFNTLYSLIPFYIATQMPLAVFILTIFFRAFPLELRDAAEIDGCSDLGILWRIYLPLSKPALATTAVIIFFLLWNEFPLALVLINDPSQMTLPVGLTTLLGRYGSVSGPGLTLYCAAIVMGAIPVLIVYLIAQKWLIAGLTAGAIKG